VNQPAGQGSAATLQPATLQPYGPHAHASRAFLCLQFARKRQKIFSLREGITLRCYTPLLRCGPYNYTFTTQLRSATQLALLRRCLYARRYALALPSLVCSYCVRATRRTCVLRGCALRLVWRCYAHCNSNSNSKGNSNSERLRSAHAPTSTEHVRADVHAP